MSPLPQFDESQARSLERIATALEAILKILQADRADQDSEGRLDSSKDS